MKLGNARPGQRKFPSPSRESNSRPSGSVVGTSDIVFGGSWVQFSPRVRNFSLSRASIVSPPSKLKMFTGTVCVLLTSVSLKLIKIKKKIYLRKNEFVTKKQNGGWKVSDADWFYFSFYDPSFFFFLWSEFIRVQFYFIFIFLFDPIWSESIRVDPTRTGGPSWSGPTFVPAWILPVFSQFLWNLTFVFLGFHDN